MYSIENLLLDVQISNIEYLGNKELQDNNIHRTVWMLVIWEEKVILFNMF